MDQATKPTHRRLVWKSSADGTNPVIDAHANHLEGSCLAAPRSNTSMNGVVFGDRRRKVLLIVLIGFVGFVLAYYLWLTAGQPVWWDEAEYLLEAKHIARGTPDTGFSTQRPILLPLILSGFYAVGLGETSIRILLAAASLLSVYLLFLIGERVYSTGVGLVGALLYSLVHLNLFYSARILTEIPHVVLALLGMYLFLSRLPRLVLMSVPVFILAGLLRTQSAFLFLVIVAFALLTERWQVFKNKDYRRSLMLGAVMLLSYLLWQQWQYGNPLYSIVREIRANASQLDLMDRLDLLWDFLRGYVLVLPTSVLLLWAAGVSIPQAWRGRLRAHLFLFLWWLIPTVGYGLLSDHFEDRYAILAYPPIFLWVAVAIGAVFTSLARVHRAVALLVALTLASFAGFRLWQRSDFIIRARLQSFDSIRQAGLWIEQNSTPGDSIVSPSVPQITYYSERATYPFPPAESDFLQLLQDKHPRFIIVSPYEALPPWVGPTRLPYAPGFTLLREFRDGAGPTQVLSK
jgi:4-amino-4-deoxy-L-arabinose transferase-like glycosyltransferase